MPNINKHLKAHPRDCRRGAPMGDDYGKPQGLSYLQQVRLDSQGYAPNSAYFGIGQKLWCLFDLAHSYRRYVRASTRKDAYRIFTSFYGEIPLHSKVKP